MKTMINNEYAKIDFLTGLYNRHYCLEVMDKLIKAKRAFSIFNVDLNKFKLINDVYGHDIGDIVLKEVGKRFKKLENDKVRFTRFGGDEFIAIYECVDKDLINKLGKSIDKSLKDHIVVSESEFTISASVGVARFPLDSENIDDLLKISDLVMYKAKKAGANTYLISGELSKKIENRKKIEKLLRTMDVERDLFLVYQPIFDFSTGLLTSMEALVRWKHKTEGIIYPDDFIAIAEEIDVVKDITRWVFINSLKQIKIWNEKYSTNYRVSINVADSCIHNKIFFGNLKYMLETFEVKAEHVSIELTERSLSISPKYMKELLLSVSNLGIDIYIDNFGTYPIMISDLRVFKINGIKIDKKFVDNLKEDNLLVMKSMILLSKGLEMETIIKGVEEEEQYQILKTLKADKIQGFYLGKPVTADDFEKKYFI